MPLIVASLGANNSNSGGGFYSQGGQFYYVRGLGRLTTPEDIGNVVLSVHNGTPVLVKDVGQVVIGEAPRLGQFGFNERDEAVEGVILMRRGEQAQVVLNRIEKKTKELNDSILPKDVKIRPFYDRRDLIELTTRTVEDNLLRGMVLVIVVLVFFLYDFRSGLIVAATIPLSLLFAFICLDLKHVPANLLSIGAIDFGILVDAAVVMVENVFRRMALNGEEGNRLGVMEVIVQAAAEVDRPIFYAMAVIIAAFLPIYALSGPSGALFQPMADTTIFALIGALAHGAHAGAGALRLGAAARREGAAKRRLREDPRPLRTRSRRVPRASVAHDRRELRAPRALAPPDSRDRRRVHAAPGRGRALGPGHACRPRSRSRRPRRSRRGSARSCGPSPRSRSSRTSSGGRTTARTRPASSTTSSSSG